jgi:hypothetical protein
MFFDGLYTREPGTFPDDVPVVDYRAGDPVRVRAPHLVAWRLSVDADDGPAEFATALDRFIAEVGGYTVLYLIVGEWGGADGKHPAPIEALADRADDLSGLRALVVGDLADHEAALFDIQVGDLTPLLTAYGGLGSLTVRGTRDLRLRPVRHAPLQALVLESDGLPADVVRAVGECDLPSLTHLELWPGTGPGAADVYADDFAGILSGERLPALKHLILPNSFLGDDLAFALLRSPLLLRLVTLDLSATGLTDEGAMALARARPILDRLNLAHNLLSERAVEHVAEHVLCSDIEIEPQHDDGDDRFVECPQSSIRA